MPNKNVLFEVNALQFREFIRPALFGKIGTLEPEMATMMAAATQEWMTSVITKTIQDTRLHDRGGLIEAELRNNARVFGGYSLMDLRGQFFAYPWLFAHEFGAEIVPHNGKYLALPIYNALRPDGSPKFRDPKSWQRYGSFVYKQKGTGKLFLAYKDQAGKGNLKILYVLVDKVTIPARLGLNTHAEEMLPVLFGMWEAIFAEIGINSGIFSFWDA